MDKVFIQGLVQLQCKRFRERRGEGRERGIKGGREKGRGREEKKGFREPGSKPETLFGEGVREPNNCWKNFSWGLPGNPVRRITPQKWSWKCVTQHRESE